MRKLISFLFLIPCFAIAQQISDIKLDSSNTNNITVVQKGDGDSQQSRINAKHSNGNTAHVDQEQKKDKDNPSPFMKKVKDSSDILGLIIALATVAGFVWKGIPYIKKMMAK